MGLPGYKIGVGMPRVGPTTLGVEVISRLEKLPLTKFHWVLIILIWVGIALDFSDQLTLSFVIPEYSKEWGLTPSVTFLNPMLGIVGTVIGAFLFGRLGDSAGRRNLFPATILIFAVTSGLNGFAPRAPSLGFSWVVINCFVTGHNPGMGLGGPRPSSPPAESKNDSPCRRAVSATLCRTQRRPAPAADLLP
jgi:putative MFS transporter